jgi:hypothetical protein
MMTKVRRLVTIAEGREWVLTEKGDEGTFWSIVNVLHLDLIGDHMGVYTHKTYQAIHLRSVHINVCQLYLIFFSKKKH